MDTDNLYSSGPKEVGPQTPETDKLGNEKVQQDNDAYSSGDSEPQDGSNVVNQQDQNEIVNEQAGSAAEEYVNSASNNTRKANDSPLNNENGAAPGHGIASSDANPVAGVN